MLLPYLNKELIERDVTKRGAAALPVLSMAAAVILPKDFKNELLNDSKQLTENSGMPCAKSLRKKRWHGRWGLFLRE